MRLRQFQLPSLFEKRSTDKTSPEDQLEKNNHEESVQQIDGFDTQSGEKDEKLQTADVSTIPSSSAGELAGIVKSEYLNQHWTPVSYYLSYFSIFLMFFALSFQSIAYSSLTSYATSAFNGHSLLGTIGTANNIISAVIKPPLARICDVFGRLEAFCFALLLYFIGLILIATAKNVQTYAGGSVLYNAGYTGLELVMTIFFADSSSMANRSLVVGISYFPFVVTTWTGPIISSNFKSQWRWGIAMWCIILPVCALPFIVCYAYYQYKGWREGAFKDTLTMDIITLFKKLDIIGLILLTAGFSLLLLPISLASYNGDKWRDAKYIVMIVVGGVCIIAFVLYEIYVASFPAIPFDLMREPTIAAACAVSALFYMAFYCWDGYYFSFLQVAHYTSVRAATYIAYTYTFTSSTTGCILGIIIRFHKQFKFYFIFAVPIYILGQGLMIRYRGEQYNRGYLVMTQLLVGIGGGIIANLLVVSVQTVVARKHFAIVTALVLTITPLGGAIGSAISGAIWESVLPKQLQKLLPDDMKDQASTIFGNLTQQLAHPRGSDTREAIIAAYCNVQKILTSVATGFAGAILIPMWFIANPRLNTNTASLFEKARTGLYE
ncbi:plasma membrane siderophore-iron transmembrane transporter Str1 [Schizosaccharomyces osmophilus]|uniref:Plasma membrane siderophore-iron transmembrane transporter Str1 n=1 Tax=Schizosaccharomyces osmophilus TaxID=2545709 RepID=A0AAE9W9C4_9SCHI|nr:plasma membrane siderophore-iron transmembrane transporter Str1 [Schizosaccharomyces osmophilus]WBW72074.1 plasma membrane siderophore-iron transmembrane transporter Str1 [Schizosaccharomyces osmophilus]